MSQGISEAFGWELEPTPWAARAACARTSPELFFPERGGSAREAKAVCMTCPVRHDCLEYALRWHIAYGVWGGLSYRQRRQLPARPYPPRVPPPHGTEAGYHAGCRCDECSWAHRQAGAEYQRQSRRRQRDLWEEPVIDRGDTPIGGRPVQSITVRRAL